MSGIEIDGHQIEILFSEADIAARVKAIAEGVARASPTGCSSYRC
jgi:hypoxanthine-guanine phosphoribosyltransferase